MSDNRKMKSACDELSRIEVGKIGRQLSDNRYSGFKPPCSKHHDLPYALPPGRRPYGPEAAPCPIPMNPHPASSIEHSAPSIEYPASSIQYPAFRFGIADCGLRIGKKSAQLINSIDYIQ